MTTASPFRASRGQNQKQTATTTSASYTCGLGNRSVRFVNTGTVPVYVRTGRIGASYDGATVVATAGDTVLGPVSSPASVLVIEKPPEHDTIAVLADSTTAVVFFQPGEGGM
jgi:hypothetical protein